MQQVLFSQTVKYRGTRYLASTPITVEDAEVDMLVKQGAELLTKVTLPAQKTEEKSSKNRRKRQEVIQEEVK